MSKIISYTATLLAGGGNGLYLEIPKNIMQQLDKDKKRIKIKATFDGFSYRGLITPYRGIVMLLILKSIQQKLNKKAGDTIMVTLQKDEEPRIVNIPPDLQKLFLKNKNALAFFNSLSYTNRKEYAVWIESAKRSETKDKRVQATINKLLNKKKIHQKNER